MLRHYILIATALFGSVALADKSAQSIIEAIMPNSTSCASAKAEFKDECRTAEQAAPYLVDAFKKYEIYNYFEISAILSLIALESVQLKFNHNHFPAPGRPGQGTRNMMMPPFIRKYAASIPSLKSQLDNIKGDTDADKEAILKLVQPDEFSFASGAWFYSSQCTPDIKAALQTGTQAAWEAYNSKCVGVDATDERTAYWKAAIKAWN